MSQRQDIYNYLLTGASIEPLTALNLFGCLSLSQRLGELRREFNIPIQSRMVEAINGKRHACYWLDKSYITKVKAGELSTQPTPTTQYKHGKRWVSRQTTQAIYKQSATPATRPRHKPRAEGVGVSKKFGAFRPRTDALNKFTQPQN